MSGNDNETKVKVLIAYENEGKKNADIFSEIYNKIFEVEYSDSFESFEKAMEYAENSGMSHMLYFLDDINLKLVSLLDDMGGYTLDVTVDDLKKVLSQNA